MAAPGDEDNAKTLCKLVNLPSMVAQQLVFAHVLGNEWTTEICK